MRYIHKDNSFLKYIIIIAIAGTISYVVYMVSKKEEPKRKYQITIQSDSPIEVIRTGETVTIDYTGKITQEKE